MREFFFSGAETGKIDKAGRLVVPQSMRFGLVNEGRLECTLALGVGGCLTLYRRSDIETLAKRLRGKEHIAKFQQFFTLFFSTLHHTTCDDKGRVLIPSLLKSAVGFEEEQESRVVIAGVFNKIEIWPEVVYREKVQGFMEKDRFAEDLTALFESAFSKQENNEDAWTKEISPTYQ